MRKALFLLVGLIFTINVFNQSYHPIPTDSVWWVETESQLMPQSGGPDCWATTYKYVYPTGVTASINGNTFYEYRYNFYRSFQPTWPMTSCEPAYSGPNVFYAFIRNDSINKRVYIYDTMNTHQEHIVYDFNMNLGDTISPPSFVYAGMGGFCTGDTFIVNKIDSIDLGGEYRKRFGITKTSLLGDTTYIIEGVGNDLGFMFAVFCPFEDGSSLICYHHKNLTYIPASQIGLPYCTTTLAIQEQEIFSKNVITKHSPNTYLVNNEKGNQINIQCYDILGKFILEQTFNETGYLNFSESPSGVYIMYIEYNGQALKPYKFIVSH